MPLGHLGINVPDLPAAKGYYDVVMPMLGYVPFLRADDQFAYRPAEATPGTFVFFYLSQAAGDYSRSRTGVQHLAFIVDTRGAVEAVHETVTGLGSEVVSAPAEFPEYHPGYFATFWLDPFGLMLEAVCHRDPAVSIAPI
ncbi:MAG TPA: VOC family protein [Mycobacteriales bacterium]|jgi:catechol 2,3-dioxygenase-like lactoylglutathione lyase family enzyme|nr:VOC family protein [Mycobacteriales bacterium]